jgi:hypothetical protein
MADLTPRPDKETLQGQAPASATKDMDQKLDDAIADSFPASDPVQLAMPHADFEGTRRAPPYTAGAIGLLAVGSLIAAALLMRRR